MIMYAFSIHDSKVEAYMKPWFAPTKGAAVRTFTDAVNEEGGDFRRHAEDYSLFLVGSYDDATGEFTPGPPVSLGNALTFLIEE